MVTDGQRRVLELCAIRVDKYRPADARRKVDRELSAAHAVDARLTTITDSDYPANLKVIPSPPPFLFYRGSLRIVDETCSVAIVGSRSATREGLAYTGRLSAELVSGGVTVVSGLARGVDTAAHEATLESGGRTIAVIGTGITFCYPAENRKLADRIIGNGAVISRFWPTRPPGKDTFPLRNAVMSGLALGTLVIEASETSGARMQARLASEQGKNVWLPQPLIASQGWAAAMVEQGKAVEIASVGDILSHLLTRPRQLFIGR